MDEPPHYLTLDVFADIVAEFDWPAPYTLADRLPDGIVMVFPRCQLTFVEGFQSEVEILFATADTGWDYSLAMNGVLLAIGGEMVSALGGFDQLGLVHDAGLRASLDKVKNGIRNQCTIVLTYFAASILGDFSWVDTYANCYRNPTR